MRTSIFAAAVLAACSGLHGRTSGPAATDRAFDHVIVITVDGLQHHAYADPDGRGLKVPLFREIVRAGAFAPKGATGVFPTFTYPSHTSIITGVMPARHGIVTNLADDPDDRNQGGWRWYREDVRVPTLDAVAMRAGLETAIINWPVTVGARATWVLPEFWRAGTPDDIKLSHALATPGLFEETARRFPAFAREFTPPDVLDAATIDVAVTLIEKRAPALMFLHVWQTDNAQHLHGPGSREATAAIENADAQIARLVDALERTGLWERSALLVLSDHGFAAIDKLVRPGVALADAKIPRAQAWVSASGAAAYIYQSDPSDKALTARITTLFKGLAADPANALAKVLDRAEIAAHGGDPRAVLALVSASGYGMGRGDVGMYLVPSKEKGTHGYLPEDANMRASFMAYGPRILPQALDEVRLIDVAPTVARWLGLSLPGTDGHPLPIRLR